MEIIRKKAFARAGLVGNPSDGYFGKTIAAIVRNFHASVTLYEWDQLELVFSQEDRSRFRSIDELVRDVRQHGYYGGIRLVKATVKKFAEFCRDARIALDRRNFSIRYDSNIPRQVGLAGSSAIIVATLRCLMEFYRVEIPREVQPSLALAVETDELGLAAGLQDRVIQVYEGLVFMDFARQRMQTQSGLMRGVYEPMDPARLPPLYLAYHDEDGKPIQRVHNDLRLRFERNEPDVLDAMKRFAELTDQAKAALADGDADRFASLIDANFDTRRAICPIAPLHLDMIQRARAAGVTAGFPGSGGAVVGVYRDEAALERLRAELAIIGCKVVKVQVLP
jgi:glucuronokinase